MSETNESQTSAGAENKAPTSKSTLIFIVIALAGIGGGWWYMNSQGKQSTDDAYVHGHKHMVSSRIVGHVVEVLVDDNQMVKKGDVLVRLDQERYQRLYEAAEATLAKAKAAGRYFGRAECLLAKRFVQYDARNSIAHRSVAAPHTNFRRRSSRLQIG